MAGDAPSYDSLLQEALRLERLAGKLDSIGNAPEAAERYRQAADILQHAAALCPLEKASKAASGLAKAADELADSATPESIGKAIALYRQAMLVFRKAIGQAAGRDCAPLEQHIAEIEVRVMYLESLGGCPATVPIAEHIKPLPASATVQVPEAGAEPVAAPVGSASSDATAASAEGGGGATAAAPPAPTPAQPKDFLQQAVNMEAQARQLEAEGQSAAAVQKYIDCLQLFGYVQKKEQNEKIRDMVRTRMGEILDRAEALKAKANTVQK